MYTQCKRSVMYGREITDIAAQGRGDVMTRVCPTPLSAHSEAHVLLTGAVPLTPSGPAAPSVHNIVQISLTLSGSDHLLMKWLGISRISRCISISDVTCYRENVAEKTKHDFHDFILFFYSILGEKNSSSDKQLWPLSLFTAIILYV